MILRIYICFHFKVIFLKTIKILKHINIFLETLSVLKIVQFRLKAQTHMGQNLT